MSSAPQVSIGVPVYNGIRYLERAIQSLLAQTLRDLELIIVDNASTDGSYELALNYTSDPRVRVYRNETNIGAIANFVKSLDLARGKYFMWAAADDVREPTFVARMASVLERDAAAGTAMSAVRVVNPDGTTLEVNRFRDSDNPERMGPLRLAFACGSKAPWDYFIYGLFRRPVLKGAAALFTNGGAPDRVLLAQLALSCGFRYVDEPLYVRQLHDQIYETRYPDEPYARQSGLGLRGDLIFYGELFSALLRSKVVPLHRKFYAPLVVGRFAATRLKSRWRSWRKYLRRKRAGIAGLNREQLDERYCQRLARRQQKAAKRLTRQEKQKLTHEQKIAPRAQKAERRLAKQLAKQERVGEPDQAAASPGPHNAGRGE
jgi:glycosyltransferase involved in cell wall biosynthesis